MNDWWTFSETTERKFNEIVEKNQYNKHHKSVTEDVEKSRDKSIAKLDNNVDDFGLYLINSADGLVNDAEEEAAQAKAAMAADLAAKIADFQAFANKRIDEFRASKDARLLDIDSERKARQAELTQLTDDIKAEINELKDALTKCRQKVTHHGFGGFGHGHHKFLLAQTEEKFDDVIYFDEHKHHHHDKDLDACADLEDEIEALKKEFKAAIETAGTEWSARIAGARADSAAEREAINSAAAKRADELQAAVKKSVAELVSQLAASNSKRQNKFDTEAQFEIVALKTEIEGQKGALAKKVDDMKAKVKEIYEKWNPHHMKFLNKKLDQFKAEAWARFSKRQPEAEALYQAETPLLAAALKLILADLQAESESIVEQMAVAATAQVAQVDEWSGKVQKSLDAGALKAEDYMSQFLTTTSTTFFDWVEQGPDLKGYIVLLD